MADVYGMIAAVTKGDTERVSVEPIVDVEGDTLMYLVNYEEGWKILSADKRTPAVIAESDMGHISMSTDNESLLDWLEITASDMKHIIHLEDSALNFTSEQINSHRHEWANALGKEPLRFQGDSLPIIPHYDGEWHLVGTGTQEVYYNEVNHMIGAHWDQREPYNYYCPPKDSGSGNQPVGCTPVACGEMLHFLCDLFNYDLTLRWNNLEANIFDVHLPYVSSFYDYATPALLRILGHELNAHYTDSTTGVFNSLTKIKSFYSRVHISSTKESYSVNKLTQNLLNGRPVLVSAHTSSSGHTFIIDGYKQTRTMYLEYYERWSGYPPLVEERTDTIGYSSPHIHHIKMNWGWASQWNGSINNYDDWFALTANWYVLPDGDSYNQDVNILCDYSFSF